MKFGIKQYLNGNHSWKFVGTNIAKQLINKGHIVDCVSTNGSDQIDPFIQNYIKQDLEGEYDCKISYTSFINFPKYLNNKKNRFGIWAYETNILPEGLAKYTNFCDLVLAPSNFCKDIFVNNGVKEEKVVVLRHGYDEEFINRKEIYPLKGKTFKILVNIAQPHIRKNIPDILEAYGRAFNKDDDVSLILKVNAKKPTNPFEVNFKEEYNFYKKRFPNGANVIIIDEYIPYISDIYRAVDCVFSMTYAEGFGLPALEGLISNKLVIYPRSTGQLDFLNDNNSFLIDTVKARADRKMQYWIPSKYATLDKPIIDSAVEKLRLAHKTFLTNKNIFKDEVNKLQEYYKWENVVEDLIGYIK